jgi:hypothetical protein
MTNKPATKQKSPKVVKKTVKLKVLDINAYPINAITKEIRQRSSKTRHIFAMLINKDGTVSVRTNMSGGDTLYYLEKYKQVMLTQM